MSAEVVCWCRWFVPVRVTDQTVTRVSSPEGLSERSWWPSRAQLTEYEGTWTNANRVTTSEEV